VKAYNAQQTEHAFSRADPLKSWQKLLEAQALEKDHRKVPEEFVPANQQQLRLAYFHAEEWSLRLFRAGHIKPEAELVRFK